MSYKVSIGLAIKQKFEKGDVVPTDTAIKDDFCYTIISCVGKVPADHYFEDSIGEMNYAFWKEFIQSSEGMKRFGKYINSLNSQIIYLDNKEIKEIISHIKLDTEQMKKGQPVMENEYWRRAKWLVFWAEESVKRYGTVAAIGLF